MGEYDGLMFIEVLWVDAEERILVKHLVLNPLSFVYVDQDQLIKEVDAFLENVGDYENVSDSDLFYVDTEQKLIEVTQNGEL